MPEKLVETEGAVSDAVVRAMAEGALERTGANVSIAVSGIAGPSGAVAGKPVGTVWFALAQKLADRLECQGHLIQFDGDRDAVRRQSSNSPSICCARYHHPSIEHVEAVFRAAARDEQSAALAEQVAPLVTRLKAQRVPAENFHTTLCFVGAVEEKKLDVLLSAVAAGSGPAGNAALRFTRVLAQARCDLRNSRRSAAAAPARVLAERLAEVTIAAGFTPDVKPFRAHLTLARKVQAAHAAACEWPHALAPSLTVQCDRFALMQSQRGETGSIYSVVNSWALDSDNPCENPGNIQ